MRKWIVPLFAIVLLGWFVHQHYVLSSERLESAINRELPVGSSKAEVLNFINARRPLFHDEKTDEIKARLSGLAENMVYKKDVIVTFSFDANGKLISHSTKAYVTFF